MSYLEKAIEKGYARLSGEGRNQKITYLAVKHTERFSDPEEQVRAEFWAELIFHYGYDPIRIGVEVIVPDRKPTDTADLVVFHDDEQKRPYAVIECKRDGITDAEFAQAVEQACGNGTWAKFRANFVGVVAGHTRRFLDFSPKYAILEREANIVADLPRQYGKPEEFRFYKGTKDDIRPVSKEELIATIKKCHDTLWGGGKLSPPAAFSELCKLIFVKITDEQVPRKKGEPYEFQIKTHETSRRLVERIRELYERQKAKDPDVFTETIKVDDEKLRTIVSHMESINLSKTDLDTKGVAFEQFMDGFFKGDFGQYFTPREIIAFAVEMLQPKNDELVLDPACGSGGFLLYALDHVRNEAGEYYQPDSKEHYKHWHDFAKGCLFGIEVNDEIARVAKMNMIIHDDGHANVVGDDALAPLERIRKRSENTSFKESHFDVILTNPPFGAQVTKLEHPYLADYQLAQQEDAKGRQKIRANQKTEILYIERVWHFLKEGTGRAAVVLPDGVLTNSSLQYVRDFLLERFQLLAVVSLPQTAFSHFGAGAKASLLFLRKFAKEEKPKGNETIFMAAPEKIGYDATGRKCENMLPEVASKFHSFVETPQAFDQPREAASESDRERRLGFAIRNSELDGPLNPERYIWRDKARIESKLRIGDVADIVDTKVAPKRAAPGQEWDLIRIDDLANEPLRVSRIRTALGSELPGSYFEVQTNDILLARLGPTILNRKFVLCPSTSNRTIASTEFLVLRCKPGWNPLLVLWVLRTDYYRNLIYSKCRGATPSRYRLSRDDLSALPFPVFSDSERQSKLQSLRTKLKEVQIARDKSEQIWEAAKVWFEEQLLGKMTR